MYQMRLYTVPGSERSLEVVDNLKRVLKKLKSQYTLEVINVMANPGLAYRDEILATPTLIKISPEPVRRIIGDFSNAETVLAGLGLTATDSETR